MGVGKEGWRGGGERLVGWGRAGIGTYAEGGGAWTQRRNAQERLWHPLSESQALRDPAPFMSVSGR